MSTEACNLALKNTINEIKNVCPDITNILVFRETGEILAGDENTTEVAMTSAQEAFRALADRALAVGGIESVIFIGSESKVNITQFDDLYVTTSASNDADEKTIANLVRVMIPTTLKIVQNFYPSIKNQPQEVTPSIKNQPQEVTLKTQPVAYKQEIIDQEAQANEYTVENLTVLGGFMIDPDTAYIDIALIVQWAEKYGDQPIRKITLEASNGKIVQCKFQPLKGEKYENKGIVKLSDKIQTELNVHKGTKVLIKPVFETQEDTETVQIEKTDKTDKSVEKTKTSSEPVQAEKTDLFKGFDEYTRQVPVLQVMVETLGGLGGRLGNPDYVRVDSAVIASWKEMFGENQIKEVTVEETTFGKKIQCKLQPIKDSQHEGKGVTQIPEKLQQALQIKKGALVLIKPVVSGSERSKR